MKANAQIRKETKNVTLLGLCEALLMSMNSILLTIDPLIGYALVDDKSQATVPIVLFQIAGMIATFPASFLMKWFGRRQGFILGVLIGLLGTGIGVRAILDKSFSLFCLSTFFIGVYNGFAGFYRFAAADAVRESHRSRAISLVMAGGVLAALIGPLLVIWTQKAIDSQLFVGPFISIFVLQILTLALLCFVDIPKQQQENKRQEERSTIEVIKQPIFIVSLLGGMCSYGAMALVMTGAPLAMAAHQHGIDDTAFSMQVHLLGMFVPSFFTGQLIAKYKATNIMFWGVAIMLVSIAINTTEISLMNMGTSLFILGLGWNFMYISATTLLTESCSYEEQAMVQALYEFIVLVFVATFVYLSGWMMDKFGWMVLNLTNVPILLILVIIIVSIQQQKRILKI